jgi:hypothetical protein
VIPHVIVIDDFLPNADELRERALKLNYSLDGPYPGLNSTEKVAIPGLDDIVSKLVYQPVRAPWTKDYSHGSFRLALASDDAPGKIHIDTSHWSGILYLTMTVPMRFNRLVLQQPQYWHTAGPSFGDTVENGRLVYLMRFFLPGAAPDRPDAN